jgi:hypothetical protein
MQNIHMKIYSILILLLFAIGGCKKTTTSTNNQPVSTIATSVRIYQPANHKFRLDSFVTDGSKRLIKYITYFVDSNYLPITPAIGEYDFSYLGIDSLPNSYGATNNSEGHILKFDNLRRIVLDSSTLIQNTFYFAYSGSNIILYQQLSIPNGHFIDTLTLTNENMSARRYWYVTPTYTQHSNFTISYSSLVSPISFPRSIGLLLFEISGQLDYVSKNLFSLSTNDPSVTDEVVWTSDNKGRVVSGTETLTTSSGATTKLITYNY